MGCGSSSASSSIAAIQPATVSTTRPVASSNTINQQITAAQLMNKFPKPAKGAKAKPVIYYTMAEVQAHNTPASSWCVYRGNVYDITDFMDSHPGGEHLLHEKAMGQDCTEDFDLFRHSDTGHSMLRLMLIGKLKDPPEYKSVEEIRAKDRSNLPTSRVDLDKPPNKDKGKDIVDIVSNSSELTEKLLIPTDKTNKSEKTELKATVNTSNLGSLPGHTDNQHIAATKELLPNVPINHQLNTKSLNDELLAIKRDSTTFFPNTNHLGRSCTPPVTGSISDQSGNYHFTISRIVDINHNVKLFYFKPIPNPNEPNNNAIAKLILQPGKSILVRMPAAHIATSPFNNNVNSNNNNNNSAVTQPNTGTTRDSLSHSSSAPRLDTNKQLDVLRPYTPITNTNGEIQILVKKYASGLVSNYLHNLKVGDYISTTGGRGRFDMEGFWGNCSCRNIVRQEAQEKNKNEGNNIVSSNLYGHGYYNFWLFIGGGTGITPLYSIIVTILKRSNRATTHPNFPNCTKPQVLLVDCNNSIEDVLLKHELLSLANKYDNFKMLNLIKSSQSNNPTSPINKSEHIVNRPSLVRDELGQLIDSVNINNIIRTNSLAEVDNSIYQGSLMDDTDVAAQLNSLTDNNIKIQNNNDNNDSSVARTKTEPINNINNGTNSFVEYTTLDTNVLQSKLPPWIKSTDNNNNNGNNDNNTAVSLVCGPDSFVNVSLDILEKLGFRRGRGNKKDIFIF